MYNITDVGGGRNTGKWTGKVAWFASSPWSLPPIAITCNKIYTRGTVPLNQQSIFLIYESAAEILRSNCWFVEKTFNTRGHSSLFSGLHQSNMTWFWGGLGSFVVGLLRVFCNLHEFMILWNKIHLFNICDSTRDGNHLLHGQTTSKVTAWMQGWHTWDWV